MREAAISFQLRPLGRSGVSVTALGFGGGPLGNLRRPISDEAAADTVAAAWEAGIRYFDVAPLYGHGRSETRLGRGLAEKPRAEFVLSTKVGRLLRPPASSNFERHGFIDTPEVEVVYDYSRDGRASLARGELRAARARARRHRSHPRRRPMDARRSPAAGLWRRPSTAPIAPSPI